MSDYRSIWTGENRKRIKYLRECQNLTHIYLENTRTLRNSISGVSIDVENDESKKLKEEINKKYSVVVGYIKCADIEVKEYIRLTRDSIQNLDAFISRAIEVYENDYTDNLKGAKVLCRIINRAWIEIKNLLSLLKGIIKVN